MGTGWGLAAEGAGLHRARVLVGVGILYGAFAVARSGWLTTVESDPMCAGHVSCSVFSGMDRSGVKWHAVAWGRGPPRGVVTCGAWASCLGAVIVGCLLKSNSNMILL